jgi:murein L,D-transpeptidase YcbB/YkuD
LRIGRVRRLLGPALAALLTTLAHAAGPAPALAAGEALRAALAAPLETCPGARLDRQELAQFYPGAPVPLWVDASGPSLRAHQLRAALERAGEEGLSPARYGLSPIEARWRATTAAEQACLDLLLTTAFHRYGRDLATGQLTPREVDDTWHLPIPAFDPVIVLRAMPEHADVAEQLQGLAPAHGLYRRLRTALARYRRLAEGGGWDAELPGPALAPGDEGDRVAALRARLRRAGDLEPGPPSSDRRFDAALADAVRRFQRRHGLRADGVVGPQTLAALNTGAAERVAQVARAMERVRWMPHDLGRHYVLVNTAGFELVVVEDDRTVLGMRVIVGTPNQATPSFTSALRSLVINPYWNVPPRIARDSLLPRERRSPGYLAARGFRVFDPATGQWRAPDARILAPGGLPRLRQEPGPSNLMGRLSFVVPNPFSIFLHDTPARSLFEREVRACSEGCVRLERAMALALHALRRQPEWTEERIQGEIDGVRHQALTLPEPIPVYVVYLPSWVDEDGVAHFRPDAYGRERVLATHFPAR